MHLNFLEFEKPIVELSYRKIISYVVLGQTLS